MRVIEQSLISPPPGSLSQSSLPLNFMDMIWLHFSPVRRYFFYHFPHSTPYFIHSLLPILKSSLSLTLQHFYPLAGKVRLSPGSDQQFEIYNTEFDSIDFTVAESDDDFLDLIGNHPRDCSRLCSLVPQLSESDAGKSLFAVQLTVFPDHGIAIGFALHHVACDGFSYTHFIKSWAAVCRSDFSAPRPSFDRTALPNLHHYYLLALTREEYKATSAIYPEEADSVCAIFNIGPEEANRLKNCVRETSSSFHCSTFVVSAAYLWVCLVKLRRYAADKIVYFPIAIDWRQRLQPPAPAAYFGNCVAFPIVEMKAGDIVKDDGVKLASKAIGKAIEGVKDGIEKTIEDFMEKLPIAFASNAVFSIAGSPKFRVYDADFGWGRPVKIEMCESNGGVFMVESRERSGGVEIGVILRRLEMDEFTAIFKEGLKLL